VRLKQWGSALRQVDHFKRRARLFAIGLLAVAILAGFHVGDTGRAASGKVGDEAGFAFGGNENVLNN